MVPTGKGSKDSDILLKDNGNYLGKEEVAHFINNYFINVGNFKSKGAGQNPVTAHSSACEFSDSLGNLDNSDDLDNSDLLIPKMVFVV